MATQVGAAWQHGTLPPWMEQPPWFDEAAAADRAEQLAERFGPLDETTAERDRATTRAAVRARRRDVLNHALNPTRPATRRPAA